MPDALRPRRIETGDPAEAERFLEDALAAGHEGVMVKALDAPYEAGRRGRGWIKVKPVRTLDLVVLAAEWGSGRRQGWLSNLHLGARDPETGGFVMLGQDLQGHDGRDARVADGAAARARDRSRGDTSSTSARSSSSRSRSTASRRARAIPGGLALRFARVKGYRPDKRAAEADTIDTVRAIHDGEHDVTGRAATEEWLRPSGGGRVVERLTSDDVAAALAEGRAAVERRAWRDAHDALTRADGVAPLAAADLELLAVAAYLLGEDDAYVAALERAHRSHLDEGATRPAVARCAFWIGMTLALRGEVGTAGRLARACRLAPRRGRLRRAGVPADARSSSGTRPPATTRPQQP